MPLEHQGIDPASLVLDFHPGPERKTQMESKSPIFQKVVIPAPPAPGAEDSIAILSQIEDATALQKKWDHHRKQNEELVDKIFSKKRIDRKDVERLQERNFIRQHAVKFQSGIQKTLHKKGYIDPKDFMDTGLEKKYEEQLANT